MGCCESRSGYDPIGGGLTASHKFRRIADRFESIEEVQQGLREVGLESSNLIIGIDYTKSNTWTGKRTFDGQCLHTISPTRLNPYQQAISVIGRTLEEFDDDKLIPVFGFGDVTTGGNGVFPFNPDGSPCYGFQQVLQRYNDITPHVQLAGPTNFAPIIEEAITICQESKAYHILVIIADGQVTNPSLNAQVIAKASNFPLSIIVVGVGDGPWKVMEEFDDQIPQRRFDNLQFVEFHKLAANSRRNFDVQFSVDALMEIPDQYQAIKELGLLG
eukprot:TRINITY_DN3466_c0_g1_i1.p1 TRINITY_DN3466_c0_g1~~TRINITY_DN3466_c0_g1_i1.p1  ORF type:complete len:288 (-),score=41.05 TRINITY_DN3466_c0_g1_i1:156-974(-)